MSIAAALIASAVIGAGSAAYTASESKKASKEASSKAAQLAEERQADEKKIRDASVTPESASVTFGVDDEEENSLGSFNDFIAPKASTTGLGSTSTSVGLGFNV